MLKCPPTVSERWALVGKSDIVYRNILLFKQLRNPHRPTTLKDLSDTEKEIITEATFHNSFSLTACFLDYCTDIRMAVQTQKLM